MNTPSNTKSDHQPYIELVRLALQLKDIHPGATVPSLGGLRAAAITVLPPDADFEDAWHPTFADASRVELRWNEEDGWTLAAFPQDLSNGPTIWRRGFGVLLTPEEVATWLDLLLTMPSASASRDDGPYRSHQQTDRAFEADLAVYSR
ncbi:hypothetical protein KDK95_14670 [Actinospica sp. MGRD01-02]|uniref:Uncharacterized protein n=1 Tax=Actinospica acidithermotolerans TaxID=2828514 RepID=A0A941EEG1_9ACTN|nr:hypothetical protein [Actinospica acidithermotolerans]MBR7827559.1 hypothetical protein [Actinospica acidithermotolerans]